MAGVETEGVQRIARGLLPVQNEVVADFRAAIAKVLPGEEVRVVVVASQPQFGDFQCNNAMGLFKKFKSSLPEAKSPKDVGELIAAQLEPAHYQAVSVAPAGFVTVKLDPRWIAQKVYTEVLVATKDATLIPCLVAKGRKVGVDFSSPNIAKEMHVGHLRSTIHGETLCRVLEYVGNEVCRVNHLGDWGTQFGMLIEYLKESYPNYTQEPPNLGDLNEFYKRSKVRFDEDEAFKERARRMVVTLQSGNPEARAAWEMLVRISLQEFEKVYKRLGVSLEAKGESFYNSLIPQTVAMCEQQGLVETVEGGAKCVFEHGPDARKNEVPLMLVKSDGGYGYDSTDVAAVYHRLIQEHFKWFIYVTDKGQEEHFLKVFRCAERMGWHTPPETRLDHCGLGLVCGDDGKKFKTRSGEVVKLVDLLDEAVKRSLHQLKVRRGDALVEVQAAETADMRTSEIQTHKEADSRPAMTPATATQMVDPQVAETQASEMPDDSELYVVAEKIGYAAVRYFDMSQVRTGNYKFSYDKMLDPKGNTAVYLLYAYARVCAVFRKAGVDESAIYNHLETGTDAFAIGNEWERKLALQLLKLPDALDSVLQDMSNHKICEYAYDTCVVFSEFYQHCRILDAPERNQRLALCLAVKRALQTAFHLLGMQPLEQI
ncbi:arginyl-tRNA synthetase [Gregarina niphandrodes]|uniref:arginine--tRNA ligase n=1 Tax=Gregarina niphandrodes TaxID=110365 RepID=A0A023B3K9_GRENI|nr:arginyl-tRNA synthetase [Gregarina niphandrodes]EZG55606.1 arginyl-tRNA synthetase [Gregarina niphandrodes]|eukprot:XP_011131483.1 arginyl-tRNA synthetase [Gregarina niphandrodes]